MSVLDPYRASWGGQSGGEEEKKPREREMNDADVGIEKGT